jgi:signal transduction histidine kinase
MFLMPLGVAAVETLTERPRSRTAFRLGVVTALLALATVATPWFVVGPPQLRHDAFGHRFGVGRAGPGLIARARVSAWTGRHRYRAVRALPVELRGMRRWLRPGADVHGAGAHDTLLAAGLRSIHLFEYGFPGVRRGRDAVRDRAARRCARADRAARGRGWRSRPGGLLDRARAELAVTHQRLVRADRMAALGTLAAGIAHEINNPLTFIAGNAELLGDALAGLAPRLPPDATAEAQAMLRDIGAGTERIKGVVQQLLALAKDDQAAAAPVDVRGLVDVSLAMAGHHLKHRAQVVRDFDEVPPVFASAARLGQVYLNLNDNAAQAIPAGAADANQVRVAIRAAAERVVVEIVDTGVGMPPDVLARIFDPFFTTKDAGHGTGLGLSISQGIVEELGGTIDVASTPGHGTTVRVELPACAAPVVDAPAPAPAPAPRAARWSSTTRRWSVGPWRA